MNWEITLRVNGEGYQARVEPRLLLVSLLRDELGLTGTHVGCVEGKCGACTVIMNGLSVKSCLVLAVQADGAEILTVEGMAPGGSLHPLQEAFWEHHGLQCGFCTPGMLMAALALLTTHPQPSEGQIRQAISGNLCRCTGYGNIVKAIGAAAIALEQRSRGAQRAPATPGAPIAQDIQPAALARPEGRGSRD